jgi:hypothetical protein
MELKIDIYCLNTRGWVVLTLYMELEIDIYCLNTRGWVVLTLYMELKIDIYCLNTPGVTPNTPHLSLEENKRFISLYFASFIISLNYYNYERK